MSFSTLRACTAVMVVVFLSPLEVSAENLRSFSTDELKAATSNNHASVESLYCEYTVRFRHRETVKTVQCRYARSGAKWNQSDLSADENRKATIENTNCCDGDMVHAFILTRFPDGIERWTGVEIQNPRNWESLTLSPEYLVGGMLSNVQRPLAEALKSVEVAKSETVLPDKSTGFRLLARGVSSTRAEAAKSKYDVSVVFDPMHDLLPQEILITQSADAITWPGWKNHWRISEFRRIPDERSKKERWFPVAGRLEQGTESAPTIDLVVNVVRINAMLDKKLFRPEIPDGVRIKDRRSP